ncbi:hypothetical protein AB4175_17465 [Vibrio cyclitrophicus]|uniref:hypothetical protein n=1 Tax=Vibrio splendidus TaxID=29497 RepID=UPI00352F59C6
MFFLLRRLSFFPILGRFFSLIYRVYNLIYGASIPLSVVIDKSTKFPHGIHGIFISKEAKLEKDITIFHQVTIGSNQLYKHQMFGAPVIGNRCILGVGAKIIGNVKLGDDVIVASNTSISRDVEANHTVVPARNRVLKHKKII